MFAWELALGLCMGDKLSPRLFCLLSFGTRRGEARWRLGVTGPLIKGDNTLDDYIACECDCLLRWRVYRLSSF